MRGYINLFPYTMVHLNPKSFIDVFSKRIKPGRFCIEVSEQQIVGDPTRLAEAAKEFRKLGFLIAMDDIGFGRSNLETLLVLEPDVIKIDRRFIDGVSKNEPQKRMMERTLNIVRSTNAEIIAEGIEDPADYEVLKNMGVPIGQGFYWGKPAPLSESQNRRAA
ncbi:hypothetical protein BVX98_01440 [bacterium F11]|nr:hypothetical protein BVX98_01440 [bacterium F11]